MKWQVHRKAVEISKGHGNPASHNLLDSGARVPIDFDLWSTSNGFCGSMGRDDFIPRGQAMKEEARRRIEYFRYFVDGVGAGIKVANGHRHAPMPVDFDHWSMGQWFCGSFESIWSVFSAILQNL